MLYQKLVDLADSLFPVVESFPRSERFALCTQIKNSVFTLLRQTIRLQKSREKLRNLFELDLELEMLRFLVRYAHHGGRGPRFIDNNEATPMKGIPGHLATRDDIDHLRGYLGTAWDTPENRATVVAQLEAIRNTHWHYVFTRVLPTDADRAGPEPDCRVVAGQGADGAELHEFHLTFNPHSRLVTLGMTLEEMDGLLAELV